jgi:hypothetical protein
MEAGIFPWTPFDTTSLWAVPPVTMATPSVWTPSPEIQAVVTLTSDTNLTYLLAGLLDNNTTLPNGQLGVNGYFVNVTDQLPTLGLNAVVLSTLANSSQPDSGVFGAPCALCIPATPGAVALDMLHLHPHDLFSFFAGLWNSFSGVVAALLTHLATLVHALVGIVWNALIAAEAFFDHIRQGLAHYTLVFVQNAVSDLKTAGKILLDGLQVLVAFVEREITALVNAVVSPIRTAVNNYLSSVNQDFRSMYTAVGNGQPVTTSLGKPFWQDMVLPLLLMTAVAVVVETALVVVNGLSLGAGFFVGILVTVIVGTVLTLLAPSSNLISEMLSGGAVAILAMMQFLNETASGLHKGPLVAHPQSGGLCGYYQSFHTLADAFAVLDDILGSASGIVLSLLLFSINAIVGVKSLTLLASSAILSLTILAFFFDAASLLNSGEEALAFADIGFISGLVALVIGKVAPAIKEIPVFGEFDSLIEYMDYAATGMGGGGSDCRHPQLLPRHLSLQSLCPRTLL